MSNIETDILTLTDTSTTPQLSSTTSETTTPAADINGSEPDPDAGYNNNPSTSTTSTTTPDDTNESGGSYEPVKAWAPGDLTNTEIINHLTLDYSDCEYVIINKLYKIDNKYDKEVFVIDIYNESYQLAEDSSTSTQTLDSFEIEINNYFTLVEEKLVNNSKDVNYKIYGYNHLNEKLKEETIVLSYNEDYIEDYSQITMSTTLEPDQTTTQNNSNKCGYIIYKDNKFVHNYENNYDMTITTLYDYAKVYINANCKIGGNYDVLVYIDSVDNNVFRNHIYTYNLIINDENKIQNKIYNPIISFINTENSYKTNTYYTKNFTIEVLADTNEPIRLECPSDSFLPGYLKYTLTDKNMFTSTHIMTGNTLELRDLQQGDIIELYNMFSITNIPNYNPSNGILNINTRAEIKVYGNIMSLLRGPYPEVFGDHSVYRNNIFKNLFKGCTGLVSAKNLILSSMKITSGCYESMFEGCKLLFEAPMLPALSLSVSCYDSMFRDCVNLKNGPDLPAQNTAKLCYNYMFYNCNSLVYAPDINGGIAYESMCVDMFAKCIMLENPPKLNPLEVQYNAYNSMFSGCTSLKTAPKIMGIYLEMQCYINMFNGCTSLINAPLLNAGNPYYGGYIGDYCYYSMFKNCESLVVAPELLAPTLKQVCYGTMFENCKSLCYVKMTASDISASNCLYKFIYNVNNNGLFIKNSNTNIQTNIIPVGWTVENYVDYRSNYFTIVALEDDLTVRLSQNASEYRIDNGEWIRLDPNIATSPIKTGQKISFKITNPTISSLSTSIGAFTVNKSFNVEGNIMSLLYGDNFIGQIDLSGKGYGFGRLLYNCTTLQNAENLILPATILATNCYAYMFYNCTSLTSAPKLPATTLANYCYSHMFYDCTGLTSAPELPATTLADSCYYSMFYGTNVLPDCSNIDFANKTVVASQGLQGLFAGTKVTNYDLERILPKNIEGKYCLPATTLADNCYYDMFSNCKSLTSAPELPADTLAYECYANMFYGCTSLTTAPKLPADTLASGCYNDMFYGCTSLTTAPKLPADILVNECYNGMFQCCTSLTTAPELSATTLATECYKQMFSGCTSLTTAPELSVTTLATECYREMFFGCTSLIEAPELPATTLATECYREMFFGCTSLIEAPELPATTLATECYRKMFYGCSNLNKITMLATNISVSKCLDSWVYGVASSGTFVKHPDMIALPSGVNGIPTGWNVENFDYIRNYFTIVALEDGLTVRLSRNACEYRIDNGGWNSLSVGTNTATINKGQTLSFKGSLTPNISSGIGTFTVNKEFNVEGNIMSLLHGDNFIGQIDLSGKDYAFRKLFYNCKTLINASNLILPATILATYCYAYMFYGCTSLTSAPKLPATTLAFGCYNRMFSATNVLPDCSNIDFTNKTVVASGGLQGLFAETKVTDADLEQILPKNNEGKYCLPVITLAASCYYEMFQDCTSLTTAPELPATTLASNCYYCMFQGCTSLTSAPELPATILANHCYYYMFYGCSKLNYIKMLATDISATNCLRNWVNGVASTGLFVKHPNMTTLPYGASGIPTSWIVENYDVYTNSYFTIVALEDGLTANLISNFEDEYEYRIDNGSWNTRSTNNYTPTINTGHTISFRGNLTPETFYGIGTFTVNKEFNVEGNIMSLLHGDDFIGQIDLSGKYYAFCRLFYNCKTLINASNLILPATTLAAYCYSNMFLDCTSLESAPKLPATTLADSCYYSMFKGCTSLTSAPELPANTLANSCYSNMFYGCTSLTSAPELPATTLADYCYHYMFCGCTGLTEAPGLLATTLVYGCYMHMFMDCSNLNYIKMLATYISASNCLSEWVNGVALSGTFIKHGAMTSLPRGTSGIPENWAIRNNS